MASVGRPPEVDKHGNIIQKSLVNVTIPTKLANFLKKEGINRSRLFTAVVSKLYDEALCPNCYSENLRTSKVGRWCHDCNPLSINKDVKVPVSFVSELDDERVIVNCKPAVPVTD